MSQAVRVLAPNTPPDAAEPRAFFIVGPTQNLTACQSQAASYKTTYSPTSPDPDTCDLSVYNGEIIINP